ncbi:expressed unknown protein [Seminavis robusta]|uniref:Uncharacterized protein n=1 Tax=Seminavis robusta TaxID=568900 RepID=A0A9N8DUT8_9STRA|nr:expressed unknown protein [Seminavis robusta]|eukprot:Sro264_g102540.1 n/a (173) ;mRNA; f:47196-47714
MHRSDASHFYWLLVHRSDGEDTTTSTLSVTRDDPHKDKHTLQACFRLSRLTQNAATSTNTTTGTEMEEQPDATTKIGTSILYQDTLLRIWEFRLAPQAKCPFHRHDRPYCFLNLTESWTQELDTNGQPVKAPPRRQAHRQCTFVSKEHLSSHAVQNVGNDTFLQFIAEFLTI